MALAATMNSPDPYAGLAWHTSLAIIALEKLRRLLAIDEEESEALGIVANELALLSEAGRIPANDLLSGRRPPLARSLRDSLVTLVAIERTSPDQVSLTVFGQTGRDLLQIREQMNRPE